ncbi:thiamine-phosphate kinase [Herbiconiux moechotypicola]|uniref:Thiamine-monophosphate kinase n=1 Tax=Herbiconiux moechotypicola TaxID=637393 RepID=A0ABP5QU88_9MICO|nr:thiamine-phosphate kinase [Herbiconiux moechotypicola]MCS5730890.1 thiamine-phosphate kinase [Herbiconiux moechotypicola]
MTLDSGFPVDGGAPTPVETVAGLGEAEVLRRIFPRLPHAQAELLGPGDDAAVVAAPDGRYVVTTDFMVQGPDFRSAWSTPHDLGWKAAMTNLSDVAAMGARPTALVVALAAPQDTPVDVLLGIADGLRDACALAAPGCGVVGGDLSTSPALTIAVTAFGDLEGRDAVTRSGGRAGDTVAVAGDLGRAGAGLWLLFRDAVTPTGRVPDALRAETVKAAHTELVAGQVAPVAPISSGVRAALGGATAMLDVSDGLVLDARRLAAASGCAVRFDASAIAREVGALLDVDAVVGDRAADFVLRGGEDHALLASFPAGAELPEGFRRLGELGDGSGVYLGDSPVEGEGGWDPYSGWDGASG